MKMLPATFTVLAALAISGLAAHAQEPSASPAHSSGVRIVRLSQSQGKVQMDRDIHQGYEPAFVNLPITEGAWLKTEDGVAEVEFEDSSSMRLTPDTIVRFSRLSRDPGGNTVSDVSVLRGTVYLSISSAKANSYILSSSEGRMEVAPASHVQLHVGAPNTALAVFAGTVQATSGQTVTMVSQKKTLVFKPATAPEINSLSTAATATQAEPVLMNHIEKTAYDQWDKEAVAYHQRSMGMQTFGTAGSTLMPTYGSSDMNYYGSFVDTADCGSVWRPYFASAGWDPYGSGTWALYQGASYSWVSPYPWGWTPYHSGSWQYCSSVGYGWQPNNNWVGIENSALFHPLQPLKGKAPLPVPHMPVKGSPSFVAVSTQRVEVSKLIAANTFVFRNDSAGLGVPRQTFGKLGGISNATAHHGFATTSVASFSPASATSVPVGTKGLVASTSTRSSLGSSSSSSSSFSNTSHGSSTGFSGGAASAGSSAGGSHH